MHLKIRPNNYQLPMEGNVSWHGSSTDFNGFDQKQHKHLKQENCSVQTLT
jgi:hypothetical protein